MDESKYEQFVTLFVRHEAAIHSFILTMVPSLPESEDILQEASLTIWRKFDQFQEGTSFRNWAFQIAKYSTFNHVRKLSRDRHRFSEKMMKLLAESAADLQDDAEYRRRALSHCIEKLPSKDHQVLAGCYKKDATIKQFAEKSNRTANAVTKQLIRIRKNLLKCIRLTLALEREV